MPKAMPLVAVATICEKVLHEKDGTLSAIRIVDTITVHETKGLPPGTQPSISLSALICLKSGDAKGKYNLRVIPRTPSGKEPTKEIPQFPLVFEGQERGTNVIINFVLPVTEVGLYWFDVFVDDEMVTRMPLRVLRKESEGNASQNG